MSILSTSIRISTRSALCVLLACLVLPAAGWPLGALADDGPVRIAATLSVNTVADWIDDLPGNGVCYSSLVRGCSLRAAIMEANALPGDDTIALPAGTYVLSTTGAAEDMSVAGDLDITSNIVINGADRDTTIVDGNAADTVFDVQTGGSGHLNDLTIRNGWGVGYPGGVRNRGTLAITDSFVTNNRSTTGGGGIFNNPGARMTLNTTEITGNTAGSHGGGIDNRGSLSMLRTIVALNSARLSGGGIHNNGGTLELYQSSVNYNRAGNEGGGVFSDSTLRLTQSFVNGNETTADPSYGGGLFNSGTATLANSVVAENRTQRGGGNIFNSGTLELTQSEISRGLAGAGGGVSNAGQASLNNVTISGNVASIGGGWYNNVPGPQVVGMNGVTIAGNAGATAGGGIYNFAGWVELRNTIVANSTAGDNCVGSVESRGNNLDSAASCGFGGSDDLSNSDPRLGPLADNGSSQPGQTHALLEGSPAIDAGRAAACLDLDQRGARRPQDGNNDGSAVCDIGAFEADAAVVSPPPSAPPSPPPSPAPSAPPAPPAVRKTFLPFVLAGRP